MTYNGFTEAQKAGERCPALTKRGRPCAGQVRWYDPEQQAWFCDAHARPEINEAHQRYIRGMILMARQEKPDQKSRHDT